MEMRVRQGGAVVEEFRTALSQLHAPQEALEALARLRPLLARRALRDQEISAIRLHLTQLALERNAISERRWIDD